MALSGLSPERHFRLIGAALGRDGGLPKSAARSDEVSVDAPSLDGDPVPDVDIIVPVHNALEDVKACLASLSRAPSHLRTHVIVVNDGSDDETTAWLRDAVATLGSGRTTFRLVEQDVNRGYSVAVNTGLRLSRAEFVVTLNSDTIATPFWVDGMVLGMRSDPAIGIVGPLSNAATWQNVPVLLDADGTFALNILPEGISPDLMAAIVRTTGAPTYPHSPFLNGFCYMIRRAVIDAIGVMDATAFPVGYGEEDDYSIRAQTAGFALAIADDVYVHHAKSRSFGSERRLALVAAGKVALIAKHSAARLAMLKEQTRPTRVAMDAVRDRVEATVASISSSVTRSAHDWFLSQRVLFVILGGPGGGGVHSVVQEVAAMRRMGVEAQIAVRAEHAGQFAEAYRDVSQLDDLIVPFGPLDLAVTASRFDVVVATIYSSASLLAGIVELFPWILPAYYVQDYEPWFADEGTEAWHEARRSYTLLDGAVLFAKTDWIRDKVRTEHAVEVRKVLPSIDHDVYRPRPGGRTGRRIGVTAMIRPKTPRRGAVRTMEVLKKLDAVLGDGVRITIFGCGSANPKFQDLTRDFRFVNRGILRRPEVAAVLQETDLFVDLSDYQAFGRTALEAMACGAAAVVPTLGGSDEYAVDGINAVVVDTTDTDACLATIVDILGDEGRLRAMQMAAMQTAAAYSPRRAAQSELAVFAPALARLRAVTPVPARTRVTIVPAVSHKASARPATTGSGYVRLVAPYAQDAVAGRHAVTIHGEGTLPHPGSADLVLMQRDLPPAMWPHFDDWHGWFREAGGRLVYDLDDDLLDGAGMFSRGYIRDTDALAARVQNYAKKADVVTVSTPLLATRLASFGSKVEVVPNRLDERLWHAIDPLRADIGPSRPKRAGQIRIGYMGTPTHYNDLRMIETAIRNVEARYRDKVDIETIGVFVHRPVLFGTRLDVGSNGDYPDFVRWVRSQTDWDIAIIPLQGDDFDRSKSDLKFLECAALRLGIVCSDVEVYRDVARHGENCLLVRNTTEAWTEGLKRMIDDRLLRRRLADAAYRDVMHGRSVQGHAGRYLDIIDRATEPGR